MTCRFLKLAVPFFLFSSSLGYSQPGPYLHLKSHIPYAVEASAQAGLMSESTSLDLSIVLSLNSNGKLQQLLSDLYNPDSPSYHHYLKTSEFVEQFSPTQEQVEKVQSYLTANGFQVKSVDHNRLIMHVTGQVSAINAAFHTQMSYYKDHSGKSYYAPANEPQIADGLAIQGVIGLDNHAKMEPHAIRRPEGGELPHGTGPAGGLSPSDIKTAYNLTTSLNGAGQTLAVFELDGYTHSDIAGYTSFFGLRAVPLQNILVDGVSGAPGGSADEVTLDIELQNALAPGATAILVYEGPNSSTGILDTYNRIATDNKAKSISTSWGLAETNNTAAFPPLSGKLSPLN